jgi:hypothetical protein
MWEMIVLMGLITWALCATLMGAFPEEDREWLRSHFRRKRS